MSGVGQQRPQPNGKYFGQDFYIYQASFGNLAPSASATVNIQIQSDSDFEWIESTFYGNMRGASAPFLDNALIPVNITLIDSGSSRQLFSATIPLTTFAGTGKQPFILPVSRIFKSYSNIQATATSFDVTNTYDFVSLNFIGRKLFLTGQA
jgi:hypothetical protein